MSSTRWEDLSEQDTLIRIKSILRDDIADRLEKAPKWAESPTQIGQNSSPLTYGIELYAKVVRDQAGWASFDFPTRASLTKIRKHLESADQSLADYANWLENTYSSWNRLPDWVKEKKVKALELVAESRKILAEVIPMVQELRERCPITKSRRSRRY